MAKAVPCVICADTPDEITLLVDCYIMPNTQQYQYLFGITWLAAPELCALIDTYWSTLTIRPDIGYREKSNVREFGEGRSVHIPINLHGQMPSTLLVNTVLEPPQPQPPPTQLYVNVARLAGPAGGEPTSAQQDLAAAGPSHVHMRVLRSEKSAKIESETECPGACNETEVQQPAPASASAPLVLVPAQAIQPPAFAPAPVSATTVRSALASVSLASAPIPPVHAQAVQNVQPAPALVPAPAVQWLQEVLEGIPNDQQWVAALLPAQAAVAYESASNQIGQQPAQWQQSAYCQPLPTTLRDPTEVAQYERRLLVQTGIQSTTADPDFSQAVVSSLMTTLQEVLRAMYYTRVLRTALTTYHLTQPMQGNPTPPPGAGQGP